MQRLLSEDPSLIDLGGRFEHTPLMKAAHHGHADIVEWLIDHGGANIEAWASNGDTVLIMSTWNLEVVSILLNRGADINSTDHHGCSTLMIALYCTDIKTVELLLSQEGLDLDAQDERGCTALWYDHGEEEVLTLLLAAGVDPRINRNDGQTPLDWERHHGHRRDSIRLLEVMVIVIFYLFSSLSNHHVTYTSHTGCCYCS